MERKTPPGRRAKLPSPGVTLALVALFAALAGTAAALPGKDTVDSGDIIDSEVKAGDIARNAVTGKHVKEKSLGRVPDARAVAGTRVQRFRLLAPFDSPEQNLTLGGIRLDASCDGGQPQFFAGKARDMLAVFHSSGLIQDPVPIEPFGKQEASYTAGDSEPLAAVGSNAGQVTAHVLWGDGRATQIDAAYRNTLPGGGLGCIFWGQVASD